MFISMKRDVQKFILGKVQYIDKYSKETGITDKELGQSLCICIRRKNQYKAFTLLNKPAIAS